MSYESLEQNFANATGLIIDRTSDTVRVLGQASIVSKSRAVTCASSIFNYAEAPWALAISFPHPDLLLGVKAVALHPDFDKKEARRNYLSQAGVLNDSYSTQLNDFATVVMDAELPELVEDKIYELKHALTIPFSSVGVEASGALKDTEFIEVVKAILQSNKEGLVTLYDELNIPLARIQLTRGAIQKVYYNGIVGEMAFVELLFRQPAKGFAYQPNGIFDWGNIRDVSVPPQQLVTEATRRVNELPMLLAKLGGLGARYQRSVDQVPMGEANENIRWLVERLWASLDGYITVDQLNLRVNADTYTVAQGIRELINRGVVSLLNRTSPFACGGKLGVPLTSHADFDIHPGDQLSAFYLDSLSGAPTWQQGNFAGVSSVIQSKNLLHTIPIDFRARGALILKNYKLIGLHSGAVHSKAGPGQISTPTYQMMWIGALLDMGTRKLRTAADDGEEDEAKPGLRSRAEIDAPERPDKLEKYICSSCHTTNTKIGPCFNCGAEVVPPEPEPELDERWAKVPFGRKIVELKLRYGLTDLQTIIGLVAAVGLPLFILAFCVGSMNNSPPPVKPKEVVTHPSSGTAIKLAVASCGFKGTAPPEYWYEDTSELTSPSKSFGLYSETTNQKVLFILFDNLAPLQNLQSFQLKPLFTKANPKDAGDFAKIEEGQQIVGYDKMKWFVGRYPIGGEKRAIILIGAFPAHDADKSIMVVGQAYKEDSVYDYKSTLWLIDQMAEETTTEGNRKRLADATHTTEESSDTGTTQTTTDSSEPKKQTPITYATDKDISAFCDKLKATLQEKLSLPSEAQKALEKEEFKRIKTVVVVDVDNEGLVKKIEIHKQAEIESVTNALIKDINANAPFANAPKTKEGLLTLLISYHKGKIEIEVQ